MGLYIIVFDGDKVINVTKYSESEYQDYMLHVSELEKNGTVFQHGYF